MLPLGRKNSRKCSECDITCHANCAHLVPDFCGMSMETASQLLVDWRIINQARGGKTSTSSRQQPYQQYQHTSGPPADPMSQSMQQLRLTGSDSPDPIGRASMEGRPPDPRLQQSPQAYSPAPLPGSRPGTGGRVPPGYEQPPPVLPGRSSTGSAYDQPPPGGPDPYKSQYQVCSI